MSLNRLNLGHPEDRDLRALKQVEHSIEAQLEFEHLISEGDKREIELAKCFPKGKLILRGKIDAVYKTVDPEVSRATIFQEGRMKGMLYINELRKICIAVDWFS